jgi:hypothetical protein
MSVPVVGRGTQAWAGFSVADHPMVHKDPQSFIVQKSFGLKQDVKWNPIPVLTPGMQEPVNYRYEGMHSVAGNVQTPLYPEQSLALLKSFFGSVTSTKLASTVIKVKIDLDASSTTIDFQVNAETAITLNTTANKLADYATLLAAFNGAVGTVVTASWVDSGDHLQGILLTATNPFTLTITNSGSTASQETMSGAFTHTFLGQDTVPNVPLAFTFYEDLSCMNLVGCYPTQCEFDIEKGNPVQLAMTVVGMHGFDQKGTAGTSVGQDNVDFPGSVMDPDITLALGVSDQIKLAVDGGSAVEVTIAAGTYATAELLAAAINSAIEATPALLDSYRRPLVQCYFNSVSKLVFYSGSKGASSAIAWTAGTHDAGTILGRGTPVQTAGSGTNSKPTESLIQPFIATKVKLLLGGSSGTEIPGVQKVKITANNGMGIIDTIGYFFAHQPVIHKRREVKISFDVAFTDVTMLSKFLANTTISLYVLLETAVTIGTTTYKYQAEIYLNTCKILKTPLPNVSGQDYIKQTIEAQAFLDVTHQDIKVIVQNSLNEIA